MKTLVLIDSNAIVHRAYHALPKNLSNSKGELTGVTYGFALALIKILEEIKPDYIAATFDLAGPTFRHIEYKEYKATRVKADQELYDQIPRVKEMLGAFGIPIYAKEGFEADDVMGTIVEICNGHNKARRQVSKSASQQNNFSPPGAGGARGGSTTDLPPLTPPTLGGGANKAVQLTSCPADLLVYIASGDRDVYQLLNGHVRVLMLKHGFKEAEIFDTGHLKEVYNLEPEDFIDLKALMGDASDNIPGVPGIGPKTATELLLKFDTLDGIYKAIEDRVPVASHSEPMEREGEESRHQPHAPRSAGARSFTSENTVQDDNLSGAAKQLDIKERILKLLIEHKDQAFQSKMLATIRRDVPIDFELEKCRWGQYDRDKLRDLFEELQFKTLLARFSKSMNDPEIEKKVTPEQKAKDNQLRLDL